MSEGRHARRERRADKTKHRACHLDSTTYAMAQKLAGRERLSFSAYVGFLIHQAWANAPSDEEE